MFCALRVVPETSSITCLLFDDKRADLAQTAQILYSSLTSEAIYRNPTTLLAILIRETGRTCELSQRDLDSIIVEVEIQTGSGPWQDAKLDSSPRRWHSFHGAMSALHSSQDKLSFVAQSADFEIDAWRCLRVMADDHKQASHLGKTAFEGDHIAILNTIECEMTHTMTRRAQIGCLRERIGIQINLVSTIRTEYTGSYGVLIIHSELDKKCFCCTFVCMEPSTKCLLTRIIRSTTSLPIRKLLKHISLRCWL